MNDPRGSVWRKWDLHIHTPASFHWNGTKLANQPAEVANAVIDEVIDKIENCDIAAFGIMDYWTFDGYWAIKDRLSSSGRQIAKAIFPGMELRIEAPVDFRLNIHVILSDTLTKQELRDFKSALRIGVIDRPLSNESLISFARTLDASKARVHGFKEADLNSEERLLLLGSMTAKITRESLRIAAKQIPSDACLIIMPYDTSDGLSDLNWHDHPYDDNYFMQSADIFETRDAKNVDLFLGRETDSNSKFLSNFIKTMGGRPKPAISGSDAHKIEDYGAYPSDRITWIKADTTFPGLRQVVNEPRERSFIGLVPPKLEQVQDNKTKFIRSIDIRRTEGATITETWFNNTIPINPDLIAIIGNKGKGKSALADTIGLLCNTKQHRDLSFLSDKGFRQAKNNKAKHFEATVTWESGTTVTKGLDAVVDETQPELVKYIPQNFLETICTQLGRIEESDFDRELKKVIFSHVVSADRLGKESLDALIAYRTSEATARIRLLKGELLKINEELVAMEDMVTEEHRQEIANRYAQKQAELAAHISAIPIIVPTPENDSLKQQESAEIAKLVDGAKDELAKVEKWIFEATEEQLRLARLVVTVDRVLARIENVKRAFDIFAAESEDDLVDLAIKLEDIVEISWNLTTLSKMRAALLEKKRSVDTRLDPANPAGHLSGKGAAQKRIASLQAQLDEPNKRYQAYLSAHKEWERKRDQLIGSDLSAGTIKFYESQLKDLDSIPDKVAACKKKRLAKSREIHAVIRQLAATYKELYAPVNEFIEHRPLAKDKFQLNFEVGIVDSGFLDAFFEIVSHGVVGTFCGTEEGRRALTGILSHHDFNTESGLDAFLQEMTDALETDMRPGGRPVRINDQIRKGKTRLGLYEMMFSLDYLRPRYALRMGDKELGQLSPGERGTLLLVFYLLVDKDDIPLLIDQPEENLDNQTVYELLVPCIKEAKRRRQVFIVTHNPNLAVVCDAEQVICADLDKKSNHQMRYISGAIENPAINKAIVDVLEGTMPAFDNRDSKYLLSST